MTRGPRAALAGAAAVILAAAILPAQSPPQADRVRVVAVEGAVRLNPDAASAIVATVARGTILDVQSRHGLWIGVFVPADAVNLRRHGYILAAMVEAVQTDAVRSGTGAAAPRPDTAYVLDEARRTVGAIDPITGTTRFVSFARSEPQGSPRDERGAPSELLISPDGTRLVVIDIGPGRFDRGSGFQPRRRSAIVVIDTSTLDVLSRADGVWGLPIHRFSRDGRRLTVASSGDASGRPSEAVTIDVQSGIAIARLDLGSYARGRRHWLQWYLGTALSPDGQYLYVLDWGRRSPDPRTSVPGRVHVIDTAALRPIGTLDGGSTPRSLQADCDQNQVYALSDRPPGAGARDERMAELRVIRGEAVAATIEVEPQPLFVRASSDGRLHVVSERGVVSVDGESLRGPTRTDVARAPVEGDAEVIFWNGLVGWAIWRLTLAASSPWDPESPFDGVNDRGLTDFVVTPDGSRGFAIHGGASRLSILDLDERRRIATVSTQHETSRTTAFLIAYGVPHLRALTDLAIRPDGRFVYVLNSPTADLTIIDTAAGTVLGQIPLGNLQASFQSGGGPMMGWSFGASGSNRMAIRPTGGPRPLVLFAEANLLGVRTPGSLAFIDMRTNSEVVGLRVGGSAHAAALSPDGRRLYVLSTGRVSYLDSRTGQYLAALTEFEDPAQIVFAGTRARGSACQPQ
jgi:DNA-binding beta-propeller fold protein YncE